MSSLGGEGGPTPPSVSPANRSGQSSLHFLPLDRSGRSTHAGAASDNELSEQIQKLMMSSAVEKFKGAQEKRSDDPRGSRGGRRVSENIRALFQRKSPTSPPKKKPTTDPKDARDQAEKLFAAIAQDSSFYVHKNTERENVPKYIIHPHDMRRIMWDFVVVLLLMWTLFSVPFDLAFDEGEGVDMTNPHIDEFSSKFWFGLAMDFLFLTDIVLNFRTAMYVMNVHGEQKLVASSNGIAKRYVSSWFLLDLVGTIPWDYLIQSLGSTRAGRTFRLPRLAKFARIVRVMKLGRLGRYCHKLREIVRLNPGIFRLVQLLFMFFTTVHILACVFYFVGSLDRFVDSNGDRQTWTTQTSVTVSTGGEIPLRDATTDVKYLVSFYWAVATIVTVGYGDVHATTSWEYFVSIVAMTIGAGIFSFFVGNMSSIFNRMDVRSAQYREELDQITDMMHGYHMTKEIQEQVRRFVAYKYENTLSHERECLDKLPPYLKKKVRLEMCQPLLSICFFEKLPKKYVAGIIQSGKKHIIPARETIFEHGDIGNHMYFLVNGSVEFLCLDKSQQYCVYESGMFFGEESMEEQFFEGGGGRHTHRSFHAVAWTPCVLYSFSAKDMWEHAVWFDSQNITQINVCDYVRGVATERQEIMKNYIRTREKVWDLQREQHKRSARVIPPHPAADGRVGFRLDESCGGIPPQLGYPGEPKASIPPFHGGENRTETPPSSIP
jgi:CRP-like cAMP-binding protein